MITRSAQAFVEDRTKKRVRRAKAEFSDPKQFEKLKKYHGDHDEYGSEKFPEMIFKLSGGYAHEQIISDCGPGPHREKPETVLNLVSDFLKQSGL